MGHGERGADERGDGEALGTDAERLVDEGGVLRDGDGGGVPASGGGKVSRAAGNKQWSTCRGECKDIPVSHLIEKAARSLIPF